MRAATFAQIAPRRHGEIRMAGYHASSGNASPE
jgi:hypothetical protein